MATRTSSHEDDRKDEELSRPSSTGEPMDRKGRLGDVETDDNGVVILTQSRGVTQMAALTSRISTKYRILLYGGFAILAYVMSLGEFFRPSLSSMSRASYGAEMTSKIERRASRAPPSPETT